MFFLTTVTHSKLYISGCFHSTHMYLTETNVSQSSNYPYRGRHTFKFSILFYPILFNRAFDTLVISMNHDGLKKHCLKGMQKLKRSTLVSCAVGLCTVGPQKTLWRDMWKWETICTMWFRFYEECEYAYVLTYLKGLTRILCWTVLSFLSQVRSGHERTYITFARWKQNSSHYSQQATAVRYGDGWWGKEPCPCGLPEHWPGCLIAALSWLEGARL